MNHQAVIVYRAPLKTSHTLTALSFSTSAARSTSKIATDAPRIQSSSPIAHAASLPYRPTVNWGVNRLVNRETDRPSNSHPRPAAAPSQSPHYDSKVFQTISVRRPIAKGFRIKCSTPVPNVASAIPLLFALVTITGMSGRRRLVSS